MNETLNTLKKSTDKSGTEVFGSFSLNGKSIVIAAFAIHEVVDSPKNLIQVPLAPEYIAGIFNLRGHIIPVINLKILFGLKEQNYSELQKIAVVQSEGLLLGLAFDSIGEIFKSLPGEKLDLSHVDHKLHKIIKGVIKRKDSSIPMQIIDTSALAALYHFQQSNLNKTNKDQPSLKIKQKLLDRRKYVFFTVNGSKMAFEISNVHEVVTESVTKEPSFSSNLYLGLIRLRGQTVPVLDFSKILGEKKVELINHSRTLVLKYGDDLLGLVVSSVESVGSFTSDELLHLPVSGHHRFNLFKGCLELQDGGHIFLLDQTQLFKDKEISEVIRGHKELYPSEKLNVALKKSIDSDKQVFVSFKLNGFFAVPIKEVKEIVSYSKDILEPVGMSDYVKGILNLRGELVTIIDTRRLYQIKSNRPEDDFSTKIMIFKRLGNHFGLVVDSVTTMLTFEKSKKVVLPEAFSDHHSDSLKQDITEVLNLDMQGEGAQAVTIFNVEAIFKRLQSNEVEQERVS